MCYGHAKTIDFDLISSESVKLYFEMEILLVQK